LPLAGNTVAHRDAMTPYLDLYLAKYPRERRITMRMLSEMIGILEPQIPMGVVSKVIGAFLYLTWYLVYIQKRAVWLPNIGKFYAIWTPTGEITGHNFKGEKFPTIRRGKWRFRFKTYLMGMDKYMQFREMHKKTAKEYLNIDHPELLQEMSHEFFRDYQKRHGIEYKKEDWDGINAPGWENYLKEWIPYKEARRAEDLLALRKELEKDCSVYLDKLPDPVVKSNINERPEDE